MRAQMKLTPGVSVRGAPSLHHARFANLMEMPSDAFLRFLEQAAESNPCLGVQPGRQDYYLDGGRLSPIEDKAVRVRDSVDAGRFVSRDSSRDEIDRCSVPDHFTGSLRLYLQSSMRKANGPALEAAAEAVIPFIDDRGFLSEEPEEIASDSGFSKEEISRAIGVIKSIPPGGVGSRNLPDFLWWQCRGSKWDTPAMHRLTHDLLRDVARGNISRIRRELRVGEQKVRSMVQVLKGLRPYPTHGMDIQPSDSPGLARLSPDFWVRCPGDGSCMLEMREPDIEIQHITAPTDPSSVSRAPSGQKPESEWDLKARSLALEARDLREVAIERGRVLRRVAAALIEVQKEWLSARNDYLEPLTESELAEQLDIPLSTVSRALKDRYVACPRGTYPLKHLLSRGLSAADNIGVSKDFVCQLIARLDREAEGRKITDAEMAKLLEQQGIHVARRTVNKYRNQMSGF
jgi:RNA polymerase sigma-54 factor